MAVLTSLFAFCPAAFSQTAPVHGKWQRQIWNGIGGTDVSDLTSSPRFYQAPNSQTLTDYSYTQLGKNYYGARSRGYITPTATGLYTFWVAGDDEAQWFVSSTTSKSDARMISSTSAATPVDGWDQSDSQRSKSQFMEAGKSYYVELLHKQATGNDNASVAWSMQGVDAGALQNWATTANGATASQSSNFDPVNSHPASNAIDGNESTYNYTSSTPGTWLQVDLGQDRPISSVELYNRQDSQSRLSDFRLSILNAQNHVVASKDFYVLSGSVGVSETWNLPEIVTGSRVKIEFLGPSRQGNYYLNLGEMRVFGYNLTLKNWSHMPAAVATQSTSYSSYYPAANLMDGNVNTFQHTANVAGSWVQVDLGADRLVDTVELINRLSICQNRLSNFRVSVLNAADAVVTSHDYDLTSGSVQGALRWELPQAVTGRKVRVTLLGLNRDNNYYLHLAELNVWGRTSALVSTRGLRSPVPSTVMSSFVPSLSDDRDDDGIPDAIELANGLNPDDPTDATQDFDHDGINNLTEIRAGSNPLIWDSVTGVLVDEIWLHVPGDKLNALTYKTAFTRDPDIIANVTTTRALNEGDNSIRRIRGFITAPVTGAYQFWGAADDDFSFYLSTTASKFDRALVIDNNVLSNGENYDIDISQKSRLINLTAGQKYYFELWHKEGVGRSVVSLVWKAPGGIRQLIPTQCLSSFGGETNDYDDDYLKDDYELANGLSITDDGKSPGSKDGAYGDLDGDGLTNLEEMKAGTKANLKDSDGDSVSDYDELNFFNSATLANNVSAFTPVATLKGDAYTSSSGLWQKSNETARQYCRRGSVTYPITVSSSGIYALKFTISSIYGGALDEQYVFGISFNGKLVASQSITVAPDGTGTLALLTPWMVGGTAYQLELFVDNSYNDRRVSIDQLQILAVGGADSNNNNIPDWVDIRLHDTNGFDSTTILSKTSPATVAGKCKYLELLNTGNIAIKNAPNARFYTDVALTPGIAKNLNFTFENGAITETATVQWLPTNLLLENNITLRQGDSLLLTAFVNAEQASLENYTLTAIGHTYTKTANLPTQVNFTASGTTTLQLTHTGSDALVTSRSVTVTVLPKVTIIPPLCVTGYPRIWTHPTLPAGAQLQFDNQVTALRETTANTWTIGTSTHQNKPLLIRQGATGPILGCSEVKSVWIRTSSTTGNILQEYHGNYSLVEMPVVVEGDLDTAELRCEIIIGGVTFTNGTTTKSLFASNFDSFGTAALDFKAATTAHSNCHRFSIWHRGQKIALSH